MIAYFIFKYKLLLSYSVSNYNVSFISVKPTSVAILEKPSHVSAGREIKVVCQSLGGYPPPKLTWWLGSKMLKSNEEVCMHSFSYIHHGLKFEKSAVWRRGSVCIKGFISTFFEFFSNGAALKKPAK